MGKHTPGPWFASNIGLGPEGKGPFTFPLGSDAETAAANARLIAAAPEMLAALRDAAGTLSRFSRPGKGLGPLGERTMARIQVAIAKATGE